MPQRFRQTSTGDVDRTWAEGVGLVSWMSPLFPKGRNKSEKGWGQEQKRQRRASEGWSAKTSQDEGRCRPQSCIPSGPILWSILLAVLRIRSAHLSSSDAWQEGAGDAEREHEGEGEREEGLLGGSVKRATAKGGSEENLPERVASGKERFPRMAPSMPTKSRSGPA